MIADNQTLRELNIFPDRDGGASVFAHLDRTITREGRKKLRDRFRIPLSSANEIKRVQDSLRFLIQHDIRFDIRPDLIDEVIRYTESSWEVGTGKRWGILYLDSVWIALRYKELMRYAERGAVATRRLLIGAEEMVSRIKECDPPSLLTELTADISTLVEDIQPVFESSIDWPWQIMDVDRKLRGEHKEEVTLLIDGLCELDALCAMSHVTREESLEFPEMVDADEFTLEGEGVYHIFLDQPVANEVRLDNEKNLMFLTGPNMAGKTTYLKSVAIAVYLAHLGIGIPAKRMRLGCLDHIFTGISPEENVRAGLSYYMAEVVRIQMVSEELSKGSRALVLFDELFRGTNVRDAFEASLLVIRGFSACTTSGFLVSSHLVELAEELADDSTIGFAHFEGQIADGLAEYAYRLTAGVSNQRFGLHLLNQAGVPDLLDKLSSRKSS